MDLVIKPTERCNFNCSFCSSPLKKKTEELSINKIKRFLIRYPETRTIIVNGGDPLMMSPEYYFEILDYIKENNLKTTICLMTNLLDFVNNPDKWTPLFKEECVRVGTSFQYGNARRIGNKPYTEDMHRNACSLFSDRFGYVPMFISVISEENESTAIQTVELAKSMNTACKLNPANKSGRQSSAYPLYKMYKIYLRLFELELDEYEQNSSNLREFSKGNTPCSLPYNKHQCDKGIRCLGLRDEYHACPTINDDHYEDVDNNQTTYNIDFDADMNGIESRSLLKAELLSLKSECLSCSLYKLCNNCAKYVKDSKEMGSKFINEHCAGMKSMQSELEKYL